jgi:Tfp pilus assembly protein PilV
MIEVMVAMLITAIAIMGLLALYISQARASGYSRHTTEATVLATDKIEKLRTMGVATAVSGTETGLDEKGIAGSGLYTRTWSETLGPSFADLVATVTWDEDGVTKTVTLRARRNL